MSDSAADAYHGYVDKMIPLSKEIARADAARRESATFASGAAAAQVALSGATDAGAAFASLAEMIKDPSAIVLSDGSVDLEFAVEQYLLYSQMATLHSVSAELFKTFEDLSTSLAHAADGPFDDYSLTWLQKQFSQEEVELFDGVFPVIIIDGDPVTTTVSIIVSVVYNTWTIIANAKEEAEIEEDKRRLRDQSATDTDYRSYAKEAATGLVSTWNQYFVLYEALYKSLMAWHGSVDVERVADRRDALRGALNSFVIQQVNSVANTARDDVRRQLGEQDLLEAQERMSAAANIRIAQAIKAMSQQDCASDSPFVQSINADLDLAQVMQLDATLKVSDQVSQWLKLRAEHCTGQGHSASMMLESTRSVDKDLRDAVYEASRRSGGTGGGALKAMTKSGLDTLFDEPADSVGGCAYAGGYAFGTFCKNLHDSDSGGAGGGMQTSAAGGFCQSSSSLSYSLCPGGALPSYDEAGPWSALRTLIAANGHLPGQYQAARGAAADERLQGDLNVIQAQNDALTKINADLDAAQSVYRQQTVAPAVDRTLKTINVIQDKTAQYLVPSLSQAFPKIPDVPGEQPSEIDLASEPVRERIQMVQQAKQDSQALWKELEPVTSVVQQRLTELPETDRRALSALYQGFVDDQGLLNSVALGDELGAATDNLAHRLDSSLDSVGGRDIREEMNRGLAALASGPKPTAALDVMGGLAFIKGADTAFAQGASGDGQRLLADGTALIDFALGLTPISSLNDAIQIVYGMATGRDYAGNPMAAADFALRGIGIIIGLLPGAHAGLTVAGKALGPSFEEGARVLGKVNLRAAVQQYFQTAGVFVNEVVKTIAEAFPWDALGNYTPDKLAGKINSLLLFEHDLANGASRRWYESVWLKMREGGEVVDEGAVKLFDDRTFTHVDLPSDGVFARVVPKPFAADIISGVRPLSSNPTGEAFITAAGDLTGYEHSTDVARRLGLYSDVYGTTLQPPPNSVVLRFQFDGPGIVSPVNFDLPYLRDSGWIYGGITKGGAREWIIDANAVSKGHITFIEPPIDILP